MRVTKEAIYYDRECTKKSDVGACTYVVQLTDLLIFIMKLKKIAE
jgi:hypothetical protein